MSTLSTTDRLLDSAEALFFTDGIAVTGVDRVAEHAGVAIATLYKRVGSKERLLESVLERRQRTWVVHWDECLARATTPEDRLLAVFDAVTEFRASAGPTQWCCFLATASERPGRDGTRAERDADPVAALVEQDTRTLTGRLRDLAVEGGFSDPAAVAADVLLLYNGALGSLLRGTPDRPVERARDLARAVLATNPRTS